MTMKPYHPDHDDEPQCSQSAEFCTFDYLFARFLLDSDGFKQLKSLALSNKGKEVKYYIRVKTENIKGKLYLEVDDEMVFSDQDLN